MRRAAVAKLMDPAALAAVARSDSDESVRDAALTMLRDIALDAFEGVSETESLAAVEALSDVRMLAAVAKTALREEVALRALGRVSDAHAPWIHRPARRGSSRSGWRRSRRSQDRGEILNVALNSDFKDTAVAAVERLDDRGDLEQVAARGKNRSALKRARTILREMDERAAAEAASQAACRNRRCRSPGPAEPWIPGSKHARRSAARRPKKARRSRGRGRGAAQAEKRKPRGSSRGGTGARPNAPKARPRRLVSAKRSRRASGNGCRNSWSRSASRQEERAAQERQQQAERAEAQAREARVRQEALARLTQLAARTEPLAARVRPDTQGRRARLARRANGARRSAAASVQARARRHRAAAESSPDRAHGEGAGAAGAHRLAAVGESRRPGTAVREDGGPRLARGPGRRSQRQVRALQEQWRAASDVPRPQGDVLWRRFKAAHDVVWSRCEAHFAAEAAARAENLAKKIALCEKAEALADVDPLDSDRRGNQAAAGRVEDDRRGQPRPGEGDLGAVPERVRSLLHTPAGGPRRAQEALGREHGEEGSAVRARRGARRLDRLGRGRR